MSKVTIYQFRMYDIGNDEYQKSHRWGTREAIAKLGGEVFEETAIEVDASVVDGSHSGLTERNYDPHASQRGIRMR